MKTFEIPNLEFTHFDVVDILTASGEASKGKKGLSPLDEERILSGEYDDDIGGLTWIQEDPVIR